MALVEFDALTMRYGTEAMRPVLDGVTGRIMPGEFLVVLGRSGSGKSTLLNLLAGLDRPTSGSVRFDGESLFELPDAALTRLRRRRIGIVFQSYNLVPTLTVAENLRLPLGLNGLEERTAVKEWLERVGLSGYEAAWPEQLSGGEQQRVAVARALIHAPELILADEPTGNLDLDNARRVVELLDDLCRAEGRTLVMVTHSREVAGRADRLLTIERGRLVDVAG
ncbi:ABC transporter ATP-binding protein [Arhodomonas sp. SL1]|uniref:ABC transporter ATP-binding protein n=1 Tax=Arhodomonas sp. SL1 TaxID=3425691 RepID=UPI003F885C8A